MQIWYSILDQILPFEWLSFSFMKNAFLAILFVAPTFGLLSTMVVNNKLAFFSEAIGHSTLTGIAIGVIFGIGNPLWAMLLFSLILAILISIVNKNSTSSTDTIIGVFSSASIAIGTVILSRGGGFAKYSSFLIGDLLSITPSEIGILVVVFLSVLLFWIVLFNQLVIISMNKSLANSRRISVFKIETLFTVVIAIIVTVSIQWVGLLIINSFLILPAATSRNLAQNIKQYHIISIAVATFSGIVGLIASYYIGSATGATIVVIMALCYLLTLVIKVVKKI
ncbi:MAG TPA: metal ABC transporter permease [Epulopiscium sp.]|nr:metal ABC transporter permease [Candidatus Epulonipiscium sp.]